MTRRRVTDIHRIRATITSGGFPATTAVVATTDFQSPAVLGRLRLFAVTPRVTSAGQGRRHGRGNIVLLRVRGRGTKV